MELKEKISEVKQEIFEIEEKIEEMHDEISESHDTALKDIKDNKDCISIFLAQKLKRKLGKALLNAFEDIEFAYVECKRFRETNTMVGLKDNEDLLQLYKKQKDTLEDLKGLIEIEMNAIKVLRDYMERYLI